ncbi:lactonase family protein [Butyrivibrio sp. VCD2006]|uniref:lactonase family protein n=1 Tax=Butyrivibrio sp. VCD2006 TaxID=1280664 RepID=UPI0004162A6F|nr:lactonase family protein [Butyrivibrio sp. VCD2006]
MGEPVTIINDYFIYVGSYNDSDSPGIYLFSFDGEQRKLQFVESYNIVKNPSYLALGEKHLYAVSELPDKSTIYSFKRDLSNGRLELNDLMHTGGTYMCHLSLDSNERHIVAACYGNSPKYKGNLVICPIDEGKVMNQGYEIQRDGIGYYSDTRQECSHIHSSGFLLNDRYMYVADLGLDKVYLYEMNRDGTVKLAPDTMQIALPDGEGPRHLAIRGNGKYLYIVTELGGHVFVYEFDSYARSWKLKQRICLIDGHTIDENYPSEIRICNDDRFLYVANRGENTIAIFGINALTGELEFIDRCDSGGKWPRHFCISDDDRYLLVANQLDGNISIFSRDRQTGCLITMGGSFSVPNASFVTMVLR